MKKAASTSKFLTTSNKIKISYQTDLFKDSPFNIILVHGLGGDSQAWNETKNLFMQQGLSVTTLDLRGHGQSSNPQQFSSYAPTELADDIVEVINAENLKNNILVGHCYGGMISIVFANKFQKQLKALVLIDTGYKTPAFNFKNADKEFIVNFLKSIAHNVPGAGSQKHDYAGDWDLDRVIADIHRTTIRSFLLSLKEAFSFDASDILEKITLPTLIIHGTEDSVIPSSVAEDLQEQIQNSELKMIPGGNHVMVLNDPEALTTAITKFLSTLT